MNANPQNASLGLPDDQSPGTSYLPGMSVESGGDDGCQATDAGIIYRLADRVSPCQPRSWTRSSSSSARLLRLHEQIRQRRAREKSGDALDDDVWQLEHFVLDEVLQLVAERARTLTGADGVAIAMAEDDAIVCRAAAGNIAPEPGARLDPKSGFSGACLRTGGIVRCDDSEHDPRVNVQVCRLPRHTLYRGCAHRFRPRHHWIAGSFFG